MGNPGGVKSTKTSFGYVQRGTDFFFFFIFSLAVIYVIGSDEDFFGDDENFVKCNVVETPVHIQPEWYFLIAYAILRSITNKLGGVVALALSIAILILCPFLYSSKFKGFSFYPLNKLLF